jgi:hypothetical protein
MTLTYAHTACCSVSGRPLMGRARALLQVTEDLSYVVMLRRKFGYLESIPGVLLPHPSSAGVFAAGGCVGPPPDIAAAWSSGLMQPPAAGAGPPLELYDPYGAGAMAAGPGAAAAAASMHIMPSMSSLEALLSKLPSVVPPAPQPAGSVPGAAPPSKDDDYDDVQQCHGMDDVAASNGAAGFVESASPSPSPSPSGAASAPMSSSSYFVNVGSSINPGDHGF